MAISSLSKRWWCPAKKQLRITGQIGEVMKESVEAALSHIRTRSMQLGIPESYFETHDIHVHVPGGAVPKDGPSAGVTIAVALASALTGWLVRLDLAMTGEITLRDLEELPDHVRTEMTSILLDSLDEALDNVLTRPSAVTNRRTAA